MSETFNLDRKINIDNSIDPTGKKWEIVHIKGSALYEARPNPYNSQTKTPDEFVGRWTKPGLLQDKINVYLERAWDLADMHSLKAESRKRSHDKREATKKKNAQESLDELPNEIKEELGDIIATTED